MTAAPRQSRVRRIARARRGGERGLSLVEMLVATGVIAIGVVGIASGVAAVVRTATNTQDQARLEVGIRQLSDLVRLSDSLRAPQDRLTYRLCAAGSDYQAAMLADVGLGILSRPPGLTFSIDRVSVSTGSTAPLATCAPGGVDAGVQEITVSVSSANRSLTRVVWKGAT